MSQAPSHATEPFSDRAAATAVERHHAQLADALNRRSEALLASAERWDPGQADLARQDLLEYLRRELVPHAVAEERTMYPAAAARPDGARLIEGMVGEHRAITQLIDELTGAASPVRAAAAGRALTALFASHLAKENELVLPMLVAAPEVSLADLLAGMHELLGGEASGEAGVDGAGGESSGEANDAGGCGCGGCGCGGDRPAGDTGAAPVLTVDTRLDVRGVPHEQRHTLVLSTVEALAPGEAVVLVAPHPPRPVLAEVDARFPSQFDKEWLQSGPDVWQIRLYRVATAG